MFGILKGVQIPKGFKLVEFSWVEDFFFFNLILNLALKIIIADVSLFFLNFEAF